MKKPDKRFWCRLLTLFCVFAGNLLFFLTIWMANKYDDVSIDQFIYQLKTSAAGANRSLANSAVVRVGVFGLILTLIEVFVYVLCSGKFRRYLKENSRYLRFCTTKIAQFISKKTLPIALSILVFSMGFFTIKLNVTDYVSAITTESNFIEEQYINPHDVKLTFPKEKRNLIYVFVESMEITFSDPAAGGPIAENYIPELTALAENNINFSHTGEVGGARSFAGTTWTAAAMVTQTSGVIVQVPLTADNYGGEDEYIPGLISLGEILEAEGYNQALLMGSDGAFAGRDSYFTEHGNYQIIDINSLKAEGRLPEDYREWWGFEDQKLFAFAKEEILKLAQKEEPFNFTLLTCDSHFPSGYVCELCPTEYDTQYPNVLRCTAKQVTEFVSWIKEQPFYDNTTIVISGDHLTMDPQFFEEANKEYERTIFNCIINAPVTPSNEKFRDFGTFDMFPTTLAAMGVNIDGDRLGLGTNLFSDKQTLAEQFGIDLLDSELQKKSEFYNNTFLEMDQQRQNRRDKKQNLD